MTPDLIWTTPFILLLLSIALVPLFNKHWWEKYYPFFPLLLGCLVVSYYWLGLNDITRLAQTAHEYFSFIVLIGSLFIVAGGIHIQIKGEATPFVNCVFLVIGAILANFVGTTGASMILIRPWIRMNKYRFTAFHIVFFIFIVSNIGGGLTPIGDPPLFLGYLKGVPFFWVLRHVWLIWVLTLALLLIIFFFMDHRNFMRAPRPIRIKETSNDQWRILGIHNVFFLVVIVGAVFINHPHFLREALMIVAAALSYKTTAKDIHKKNDFNFLPIKEVALLFLGIFATMIPALQWLEHNAVKIGIRTVDQFFWGSGILSSVLDNAPTYLNFLSAGIGLFVQGGGLYDHEKTALLLAGHPGHVLAISVASVFFGAMTYIGNGPNFLVKSIADQSKVKTPSFFGYLFKYSLTILLPVLFLIWFLFIR